MRISDKGKYMFNIMKKIINKTLILVLITMPLFLTGCGDNEMVKEVTNAAKKAVEGEIAKTGAEVRKKIDQVAKLDNGQDKKEDKQSSDEKGKEFSEKKSDNKD